MSQMQNIEKVFAKIEDRKQAIETVCKRFNLKESTTNIYYSRWNCRNVEHKTLKDKAIEYLNANWKEGDGTKKYYKEMEKIGIKKSTAYQYFYEWETKKATRKLRDKEPIYIPKFTRPRQKFYIDDSKLWR